MRTHNPLQYQRLYNRRRRRRMSAQTTGTRRCTSCKSHLPVEDFQKGQDVCRACVARRHRIDPRWRMVRWCRVRAKREGKRCDLQIWELKIPTRCPCFGWPLIVGQGRQNDQSPTAVRIYHGPAGAFSSDNVRIASKRVQQLIGALQPAEHRRLTQLLFGQMPQPVDAGRARFDRSLRRRMIYDARIRAKRLGLVCTATAADVVIPLVCPVTGVRLRTHRGHAGPDSPALIRLDNDAGWTKENIAVVAYAVAVARSDGTPSEHAMIDNWLQRIGKVPAVTSV